MLTIMAEVVYWLGFYSEKFTLLSCVHRESKSGPSFSLVTLVNIPVLFTRRLEFEWFGDC